jgi:hypothetical protein
MRLIKDGAFIIIMALTFLMLGGCELKPYTDTILVEGHLLTPTGKVPFKRISSSNLAKQFNPSGYLKTHSYFHAVSNNTQIIFNPSSPTSTLNIVSPKDGTRYLLDIEHAFYQIDNRPKVKWEISTHKHSGIMRHFLFQEKLNKYYSTRFDIEPIEPGSKFESNYRYFLPFIHDDKKFTMDITVEFNKNHHIVFDWGFPGSP